MVAAYVLLTIRAVDPLEILGQLRAIPMVQQAHILLGPTDAIVYIECPDHETLRETILSIRAMQGVEHSDTRYVCAYGRLDRDR